MKYGVIINKDTFNLGDDIQSYATEQFLPHTDYEIDREKMDSFCSKDGERVATIMGGWFLYNHLNWPPSPFIYPLPISMHFDTFYSKTMGEKITKNFVFEDCGATWFLENGPVGARDEGSKKMLEKFGIPTYFSGCITLTINPFENVVKHNKICLVDISEDVKNFVKENATLECIEMTHSVSLKALTWEKRKEIVEKQLKYYQGASLVVTTRLHVALPCLVLGVPVLFIKERWALNRTGTWLEYVNNTEKEALLSGEYAYDFDNPLENSDKYMIVRNNIIKSCEEYILDCEKKELEYLDKSMFLDGCRRTERLKKLMHLRIDKYERELNNH
ncbi:MAG: polysaccharide pyruvyl transferase family protein [Lachnospirales bacterium]